MSRSLVARSKKFISTYGAAIGAATVLSLATVEPALAAAASSEEAKAVAARIETNVLSFKKLAMAIAFLIGVVLFIAGLWMFYKDSKQPGQGHAKNGLIAILVGTGLLVIQSLVGITAQTVVADGASGKANIESASGF